MGPPYTSSNPISYSTPSSPEKERRIQRDYSPSTTPTNQFITDSHSHSPSSHSHSYSQSYSSSYANGTSRSGVQTPNFQSTETFNPSSLPSNSEFGNPSFNSTGNSSSTIASSSTTINGNGRSESIGEAELIALVVELRLRASRSTSSKEKDRAENTSISNSEINGGQNGKEKEKEQEKEGSNVTAIDTLDLCHRKIEVVPEEFTDVIKDDVVR